MTGPDLETRNLLANPDIVVDHTDGHLALSWQGERPCLSSAPLNGGFTLAERVLNLRVDGSDVALPPEATLQHYADDQRWPGRTVGLMTAAGMDSLRYGIASYHGETLELWLTCGLNNARRAGDPADWQGDASPPPGTINTVLATSLNLPQATMVELMTVLTEAKCAALQDLGVVSPISGAPATGTGTDAMVIVSGYGRPERWAGKHTLLGEKVARLMMTALRASIDGTG